MFQIVTDSSANLPDALISSYGLSVVPLYYVIDGTAYAGSDLETSAEGLRYYDRIRAGLVVKTSMVNSDGFLQAFEPLLKAGRDILFIGMSAAISGTFRAASLAAEELLETYPDRKIRVINTRAASLGEGIPVLDAVRWQRAGLSLDEVAARTQAACGRMCQYFTVDDLEYLKRGGRISAAVAFVGKMLNIKVILKGNSEGSIVLNNKVRGRIKALDMLVEKYKALITDPASLIGIAHADCLADATTLKDRLKAAGHTGRVLMTTYEPVTGAHVGPGALALFFYGNTAAD